MPPKRRAPAATTAQPAKPRRSKLAREHSITAEQEAEIREAFSLFAVRHPDYEDSKEGVLRAEDVRRCLIALNLSPSRSELPSILSTLDPASSGLVPFEPFLGYAALALNHSSSAADLDAEVLAAYSLFTHGAPGPITLSHLKRVARELKEDVDEKLLADMILEANGGAGMEGVRRGVGKDEFEDVMRRAGVFS